MKIYKITVYLYLVFALFFAYEAYISFQEGKDFWIRLAFAVVALFMFFFRLRNLKKIDLHKNQQK